MPNDSGRSEPLHDRSERAKRDARRYEELVDRFDDDLGPRREEIEAWAARQQRLRKEWLEGPNERDRLMWARRERMRRLNAELSDERGGRVGGRRMSHDVEDRSDAVRDFQLAAQGAAVEFFAFPFRCLDFLIDSGRRFERSAERRRGSECDDLD